MPAGTATEKIALTEHEKRVLTSVHIRALGQTRSRQAIADSLSLSKQVVDATLGSIRDKLGIPSERGTDPSEGDQFAYDLAKDLVLI